MKKCPKCSILCENDSTRFCESCGTELFFTHRFESPIGKIITLYFSATGNTKYIAELFSGKMKARCHSIEEDIHFSDAIQSHDIIAFCYPICCSRVPRVMREFAKKHKREIIGKKIIIFVSQMIFSGDGARAFTDMFHDGEINIIYAEHFNMPNNVGNVPFLGKTKKTRRYMNKAEIKMTRVCHHIQSDIIVKRGFSRFSKILGNIQGKTWKVKEKSVSADVRISGDCTSCGLCVNICPMKNFEKAANEIKQKGNCTVCYRCVNQCPRKAVTVLIHRKPKWQYDGLKI